MKKTLFALTVATVFLFSTCATDKKSAVTPATALQDSLAFELCQIYGSDQTMRGKGLKYDAEIDSVNFIRVIDFIKQYGFPGTKNVGENYNKAECVAMSAIAVLLHNPQRIVNHPEIMQLLQNEVRQGNLKMEYLLTFIDKYYLYKRGVRRVFMGSQFGKPCIEDRATSDSLRHELGLPPLKDGDFKVCK